MKNVAGGCLKITNWTVTEARHLTNNVDVDVVSAGDGQAGCVSAISVSENYEVCADVEGPIEVCEDQMYKVDKVPIKKKVWTQLSNGLFAWRIRKTGRRNNKSQKILEEQGPSSASRSKHLKLKEIK